MKREQILQTAEELINGDRAESYGDARDSFERIAVGWNSIIDAAKISHGSVTASHVALMMDWLKTSRLLHSMDHEDSWVDKAAYSALGGELCLREEKTFE